MFSWHKSENFSVSEKFCETLKSAYTYFFLYCEFAKFIPWWFMNILCTSSASVPAKMLMWSLLLSRQLAINAFCHQQIFKSSLYKQFYHYPTVFKLLEPKTKNLRFIIRIKYYMMHTKLTHLRQQCQHIVNKQGIA